MDPTFAKFIEQGQLSVSNMVLHKYSQLGLTNEEFILFLQISSCLQAGKDFPDLELIAARMGVKNTEVYDLVHQQRKDTGRGDLRGTSEPLRQKDPQA